MLQYRLHHLLESSCQWPIVAHSVGHRDSPLWVKSKIFKNLPLLKVSSPVKHLTEGGALFRIEWDGRHGNDELWAFHKTILEKNIKVISDTLSWLI